MSDIHLPHTLRPERSWVVRRAIIQAENGTPPPSTLWGIWASRWLAGIDRDEQSVMAIMSESATQEQKHATTLALALARGELDDCPPPEGDQSLLHAERELTVRIIRTASIVLQHTPSSMLAAHEMEGDMIRIGDGGIPVGLAALTILEVNKERHDVSVPIAYQPERSWVVLRAILDAERDVSTLWNIWANQWRSGYNRDEAAIRDFLLEARTPKQAEASRLALALARGELGAAVPEYKDLVLLQAESMLVDRIISVARELCSQSPPESANWAEDDDRLAIRVGSCVFPIENIVALVMSM